MSTLRPDEHTFTARVIGRWFDISLAVASSDCKKCWQHIPLWLAKKLGLAGARAGDRVVITGRLIKKGRKDE